MHYIDGRPFYAQNIRISKDPEFVSKVNRVFVLSVNIPMRYLHSKKIAVI